MGRRDIFTAKLFTQGGIVGEVEDISITLPAPPWELVDVLERVHLFGNKAAYTVEVTHTKLGYLFSALPPNPSLHELDILAHRLAELTDRQRDCFEGLVMMDMTGKTRKSIPLERLINMTFSTEECQISYEAHDDASLGKFYADNGFVPELEPLPEQIYSWLDYGKIGKEMREGEGGAFTRKGYVERRNHSMRIFKNRTVIGVICILVALVICFGITPLFNRAATQKTEIVRVTREIKADNVITDDMVQPVRVGSFNLPDNVLRKKENVVGKYATADLSVGDYILPTKLSDAPAVDNSYLYLLDGSKQAMSVTIKSFANGLSGKLRSGDIVSVIAPDYKKQGLTVIPPELKYVEVIGVTTSTGQDQVDQSRKDSGSEKSLKDTEKELPATVTLLVSPEQSKVLAELEADGKMHLSLVFRGDKSAADKFLAAQEEVLAAISTPAQTPAEIPAPPAAPEDEAVGG